MEELEFDLYLETSAKTGENVEKLFVEVCKILYNEYLIMVDSQKKKEEMNKSKNYIRKRRRRRKRANI